MRHTFSNLRISWKFLAFYFDQILSLMGISTAGAVQTAKQWVLFAHESFLTLLVVVQDLLLFILLKDSDVPHRQSKTQKSKKRTAFS